MSLQTILNEKKADFERNADEFKKQAFKRGIEHVKQSGVLNKAKQVGDLAPDFTLNNALGKPIALKDHLKKGNVILTWYRGGWCPYCNLTLRALQADLKNFKALGANLIALTPELPDNSISTSKKNELEFEVLSDVGNEIAKAYGTVFKLADEVSEIYNASFGLNTYNGDASNELPIAATYIINEQGKIIYAFLNEDHRTRAEPSELINFLKKS
ncbi:MAG: peroxiredoxin family protein [Algibacter sp.]